MSKKKQFIDEDKREFGGWWLWILLLFLISMGLLFGARSIGLIGSTAVERVVFEQSYQRSAAQNAKLATFKAQKAELERQLRRQDLTAERRADYQAQLSAINIQISTIEGQ